MPSPPPSSLPAPLADLVASYMAAEYRWQHDGDWHDLRIGLPAPALELLHPDFETFGLLSAWNPHSVERSEADNRRDDELLHAELRDSGLPFAPAFASAANRGWREPSWVVVGMRQGTFDALSRRFGQLAALWWTRGQAVRLRVDAGRPDDLGHDPRIEWLK